MGPGLRFDVGLDTHTTTVSEARNIRLLRFDVGLDTHTTAEAVKASA